MSAASLRALRNQITRGSATLDTIDVWEAKKVVTADEANEARSYWHELNDPPPAPEALPAPTPEPVADTATEPAAEG